MMNKKQAIYPAAVAIDRISDLPKDIIHHIFQNYLPSHKEAARTSILSRKWLNFWNTYPIVEFHDTNHTNFQSFAAATSKRLKLAEPPLLLETFDITLREWDEGPYVELEQEFYQLLSSASIGVDYVGGSRSPLKVVVKNDFYVDVEWELFLNCGRTKFLRLERFDSDQRGLHNFKTCLDNLQELSLKEVSVSRKWFPRCLANAPRLEKLSLKDTLGIDRLDISAKNFPSLISLSFADDFRLQLRSATLLETLSFKGHCNLLKVVSAPNVKFVNLQPLTRREVLTRRIVDKFISKFPSFESLEINLYDP
ncbi:hypothetical protein LINGRAHAP2_LOCUS11736 [Linum grandiflorum]